MGGYQSLLSVSVNHEFFNNKNCGCLEFIPTDATQRILDNTGLMLRNSSDSLQIIFDPEKMDELEMYANDSLDPLSFDFKVYTTDQHFASYTYPAINKMEKILYFDNFLTSSRKKKQKLSISDNVSECDTKDLDSPEISHILNKKDHLLPPIFIIRIYAKGRKSNFFKQWIRPEITNYLVNFAVRHTYWKYYLLGKYVDKNVFVVDSGDSINFDPVGKITMSDNRLALVYQSQNSIPLQQQYSHRFQLRKKVRHIESVLINRLPVACLTQMGINVGIETNILNSEIYVNS